MRLLAGRVRARVNEGPRAPLPAALVSLIALAGCGDPRPAPGHGAASSTAEAGAASATPQASAPARSVAPAPSAAASGAPSTTETAPEACADGAVLIAAGTFRMGSPLEDKDADPDERPVREVSLRAYCMDRTEVTVARYARCVAEPRGGVACSPAGATVVSRSLSADDVLFWSKFCNAGRKDAGDHPVNCVDWNQADTYCRWGLRAAPDGGRVGIRGEGGRRSQNTRGATTRPRPTSSMRAARSA